MNRRGMLAMCVVVLGAASLARAAEPGKDVPVKKGITLTGESLGAMLEGMGLNPQEGKYASGQSYFDVVIKQNDWAFNARINLSTNAKVVWLILNLGDLPALDQIHAEALINLMRKNGSSTGKAQFCVRGNSLTLIQPFDNQDVTPARMLAELQDICTVAKSHHMDYDLKNWKLAAPTAAEPKSTAPVSKS